MSKEELKKLFLDYAYGVQEWESYSGGEQIDPHLMFIIEQSMVAAYNRAIEGAKKIENIGVLGQQELQNLKIK